MKIAGLYIMFIFMLMIGTAKAQNNTGADTIAKTELERFGRYFADHIRYPRVDLFNIEQGMVILQFKVNNHRAYDIEVQKCPSETLGQAVVSVLQNAIIPSLKRTDVIYILPYFFTTSKNDSEPLRIPNFKLRGLQPSKDGSVNYYYFEMLKTRGALHVDSPTY